jgi:hypothetical protein
MQIDPLIFGAVVLGLVGLFIAVPKFFAKPSGPTADELYLDLLPSVHDKRHTVRASAPPVMDGAAPEQQATPPGAPRAVAPTAQPVAPSAPSPDGLSPLKLPS